MEEEISEREARLRAARGALVLLTRHTVVRGMGFAGTLVLARLIAPEIFGIFAIAQFVLNLCSAASVGGIIAALVRKKERVQLDEYKVAFTLQQGASLFVFISVLVATPFICSAYHLTGTDRFAFPAMGSAVFLLSLRSVPTAVLQRSLKHDRVAIVDVVEYIVYVGVSIVLAWQGLGLWALVIGTLTRYVSSAIMLHIMVGHWPQFGFQKNVASAIIQKAVPLQLTILLDLGRLAIVTMVIGRLFGAAAVGLMSMATTMLETLVFQPITMLGMIQFRLLARCQDDREEFEHVLANGYFMMAAIATPVVVTLAFCAPAIISVILSAKWQSVGPLMRWIGLATLFHLVASPTAQALKAVGDTITPLVFSFTSFIVQLGLIVLLHKRFGLDSYAIALATGYGVATVYAVVQLTRHLNKLPPFGPLLEVIGASIVAVGAALAILPASDSWRIAPTLVFVLVYVTALLLFSGERLADYFTLASNALFHSKVRLRRVLERCSEVADRAGAMGNRLRGRLFRA